MTPLLFSKNIYFKREDMNITGSAKDRAIEMQIKHLIKLGYKSAVISSTGNAAISAQHFCQLQNINLKIFVSPKIALSKLKKLREYTMTPKPISSAFRFSRNNNAYLLRQSTDPVALTGYGQISNELITQIPQISSIFIPVGSGTTLLGISRKLPTRVKIFAVQPASFCPICSIFDHKYSKETTSITDSLSVRYIPLKMEIIKTITSGIVVQDKAVSECHQELINNQILTSTEGALAYAGYLKTKNQLETGKFPVILLTGSLYQ